MTMYSLRLAIEAALIKMPLVTLVRGGALINPPAEEIVFISEGQRYRVELQHMGKEL